jgi:ketosteroid isomerase-like protein
VFGSSIARIPDLAVVPEQIIESGSEIAIVQRYTGTAKTTGKRLDIVGVGVWDVRDGKVARYRQFVDTVKFCEVVPA